MSKIVYEVTVENGNTIWRLNGKIHREDGPAVEYADGTKCWYVNGVNYTERGFNKKIAEMHPSAAQSCAGKVVEIEGKRYQLVEVTSV